MNLVRGLTQSAKDSDQTETEKEEPEENDVKKFFFNVPYNSKGREFVGRKGKLEDIRSLLGQNGCASIGQAVNVQGLGGFGKTQLAAEYAHEYRGEYKNGVFWLVADENIDNQLLQIAAKKGWINQFDKTVNQLDVAKAKFLELSECLILFDNVESQDDIKDYLPKPDSRTHILITSRYKQSSFRQINLELLERDESRELLLKISKRNAPEETEKEHLENILETLGDIPLAIELVGGYLAEHENVTFAKYHRFLDEVPLDKLEREFPEGSFTNHDRSIIQTLRISEQTINEKPLMVEILKVLAWSDSSSMGTSLLQALVEPESEFEFETALGDAYKLRLLKKDESIERYAIHRLLAKVIQHENSFNDSQERGYAVFYLDDNAEREAVDKIAPKNKRKGKWEGFLDSPAFNEYINSSELKANIFHPSILRELAASEYKEPIFAFRIYGRHKPKMLPVGLSKMPNEKKYWIRLDKITENIKDSMESHIFSCFQKLLPEDVWAIIQSKMQLEELRAD